MSEPCGFGRIIAFRIIYTYIVMPRNARHKGLLGDPDVQRWYDNHDSWKTADGRLRNLGLFCERTGVTPKALAGMEPKEYTDLLQDYLKTYPGSNVKKAVVAWLTHFGKALQRNVKVKVVTHRDLHVPPRADVAKALDVANIRARAAIAILATSGPMPEVLSSGESP